MNVVIYILIALFAEAQITNDVPTDSAGNSANPEITLESGLNDGNVVPTDSEQTKIPPKLDLDNNNNSTELPIVETTAILVTETPMTTTTSEMPNTIRSVELTSEGFPKPFPAQYKQNWK